MGRNDQVSSGMTPDRDSGMLMYLWARGCSQGLKEPHLVFKLDGV